MRSKARRRQKARGDSTCTLGDAGICLVRPLMPWVPRFMPQMFFGQGNVAQEFPYTCLTLCFTFYAYFSSRRHGGTVQQSTSISKRVVCAHQRNSLFMCEDQKIGVQQCSSKDSATLHVAEGKYGVAWSSCLP